VKPSSRKSIEINCMSVFQPGLVHTPVTPFTREHRIDFDVFAKLIEFHIRNGADSLALPMHAGESVSLTDDEQHALLTFALEEAVGRVPVIAHASDAGTAIAAARARRAEDSGAAAVVATTPYYWTPPPAMVLEHFLQIGAAVTVPFFVYNSPEEMPGTKITAELCLKLVEKLPNFAGVVDLSLDWQFMIELMTFAPRQRPAFQLLAGTELMVSAGAIGATGMFSPLAAFAPRLMRQLFETCRKDRLVEARAAQEQVAQLRQLLKAGGIASLKAALRTRGRDCGEPRPPLQPLDAASTMQLTAALDALPALRAEPRGW
jgi:4-hydroxy-tetrahydrodipicolinate synthase